MKPEERRNREGDEAVTVRASVTKAQTFGE